MKCDKLSLEAVLVGVEAYKFRNEKKNLGVWSQKDSFYQISAAYFSSLLEPSSSRLRSLLLT